MDTLPREIQRKIMLLGDEPHQVVKVCKVWKALAEEDIPLFIQNVSGDDVAHLPSTWYRHLSVWQKVSLANNTRLHGENLLSRLNKRHLISWSEVIEHVIADPWQIHELLYIENKCCKLTNAFVYFTSVFTTYEPFRRRILNDFSAEDQDRFVEHCRALKKGDYARMLAKPAWNYIKLSYTSIHFELYSEYQKMREIDAKIRPCGL